MLPLSNSKVYKWPVHIFFMTIQVHVEKCPCGQPGKEEYPGVIRSLNKGPSHWGERGRKTEVRPLYCSLVHRDQMDWRIGVSLESKPGRATRQAMSSSAIKDRRAVYVAPSNY